MAYNLNITNADCYTGTTTLINKLGITDENELNSTEALITSYKAASIIKEKQITDFNFESYKELHGILFEDLYEWTGQTRTIALSKTSTVFTDPEKIDELGCLIFSRLKSMNYFVGLSK